MMEAVLITMTAGMMMVREYLRGEMPMFRQNHPAEQTQAAGQTPAQAEGRIPEREAAPLILAAGQILAQAVKPIPVQAEGRIPAQVAALLIRAEAVQPPVQGLSPADSDCWTFLPGTCMIVGSGQTERSCAVCIKEYS